jgi:hypothetical protein
LINIKLNKDIIDYSRKLVRNNNFGQRGKFDGTKSQQFLGIVAENTVREYYGFKLIEPTNHWDGGFDIDWNGHKTDIKTVIRTVEPKPNYVCNFYELQKHYVSTAFIFTSINTKDKILTICGWIEKYLFFQKAQKFETGSKRFRSNGTQFESTTNHYEIKILDLKEPLFNFD